MGIINPFILTDGNINCSSFAFTIPRQDYWSLLNDLDAFVFPLLEN